MEESKAYNHSFKIGATIQLLLLPFIFYSLIPALVLSAINTIFTMLVYPIVIVWVAKQDHSHTPPSLGPHQ